ncbi:MULTISPECIES: SDR family oxidoreductase [unclassified Burkholderia]|uniref:SDR family NAD(P)-dependent oxidoreductase n=1 Tax=unclassified Burkholderia TaxID=2613784 RepID=UPI000F570BE8|nr:MULTISPECIES: SDR family NAD(P)-dependent oxidoreductase [unclassified Burkholderia]RQS26493.1 SDR family NAD(P)-dependent oxidoreductase [Burkholderia sp. Bp8995]RQS48471.1 SDR family NAD(P)-dependent oxidoreductase [Burkholderia sp. Bp8989]
MEYALVTGASGGIGAELASLFARNGIGLILCSSPRSRDTLERNATYLREKFKVNAYPITEDLAIPGAAERLGAQVDMLGLHVEFLVNNAGAGIVGLAFQNYDAAQMVAMLQLNVVTLSELTLRFVRPMVARGRGRILNLSSSAGYVVPHGLEAAYAASKAYVISVSEALAYDLRGTGVTCTHVAPGPTRTNFFAAAGLVDERRMAKLGYSEPDQMALIAYKAMMAGRTAVLPGASNKFVTWLARVSPSRLVTGKISAFVVSRDLK